MGIGASRNKAPGYITAVYTMAIVLQENVSEKPTAR